MTISGEAVETTVGTVVMEGMSSRSVVSSRAELGGMAMVDATEKLTRGLVKTGERELPSKKPRWLNWVALQQDFIFLFFIFRISP